MQINEKQSTESSPETNSLESSQVLCFAFPCKECQVPILLPVDIFDRLFPHRGVPANNDLSTALVCDSCKKVDIYSPNKRSQYYDSKVRRVPCFCSGETDVFLLLQCAGEMSEYRVPLVVTWIYGRRAEEKPIIAKSWIGGHMKCPNGHKIQWPWRQV